MCLFNQLVIEISVLSCLLSVACWYFPYLTRVPSPFLQPKASDDSGGEIVDRQSGLNNKDPIQLGTIYLQNP